MRTNKSICIDIGYMPREWANEELTRKGSVRIGMRPRPYTFSNITWIDHPWDKRKTYAQINVQSSDEARILRLCSKWGWKVVDLRLPARQNTTKEGGVDIERTNEIIKNWNINQK